MERLSPVFSTNKSSNKEVEHWMNSLKEVEQVLDAVEPKLTSSGTKWRVVAQHIKDICGDLNQIFNKEDPRYEVVQAGASAAHDFDVRYLDIHKHGREISRLLEKMQKYRQEIEEIKKEYKESDKYRERYDHYKVKLDNLEKKNKDQERIERNQQKFKDAEAAYSSVCADLIQKMETIWKKHVSIFAEAASAVWKTQLQYAKALEAAAAPVIPYLQQEDEEEEQEQQQQHEQSQGAENASRASYENTENKFARNSGIAPSFGTASEQRTEQSKNVVNSSKNVSETSPTENIEA
jgi:DNA repair exonuclease SbcCD ATPase subunit